jgi:hypothetical protein
MNTLRTILIGAVSVAAATALATSASAATASASAGMAATIQSPLTITKTTDMDFGTLVKPSTTTAATVTLLPAGSISYSGHSGAATPAVFTVTTTGGTIITPHATFSPATSGLDITGLPNFALVDTSNVSGTPITLGSTSTTQTLTYGAKFDISSTTPVGAYSGTLNVSVDYQ